MDYQHLRLYTDNRVGWLEYNRPPINAFNWEMLREMPAALEELLFVRSSINLACIFLLRSYLFVITQSLNRHTFVEFA